MAKEPTIKKFVETGGNKHFQGNREIEEYTAEDDVRGKGLNIEIGGRSEIVNGTVGAPDAEVVLKQTGLEQLYKDEERTTLGGIEHLTLSKNDDDITVFKIDHMTARPILEKDMVIDGHDGTDTLVIQQPEKWRSGLTGFENAGMEYHPPVAGKTTTIPAGHPLHG